tara:strand:+ start:636 stop:1058 length:423 start_codon:yes stop_codon:yes gene_type:complete
MENINEENENEENEENENEDNVNEENEDNEENENEENEENVNEDNEDNKKILFDPKTKKGKFKVDCWHDEKNGDLTPRDVSKKSRKMCWFICDICGHNFQRAIKHVVLSNKWCQYCDENIVCDNDDCEICYNKSFASLGE